MDGVEQPNRHNEFNSQASINFSKISDKFINASISQDNLFVKKKTEGRLSKSYDKK